MFCVIRWMRRGVLVLRAMCLCPGQGTFGGTCLVAIDKASGAFCFWEVLVRLVVARFSVCCVCC